MELFGYMDVEQKNENYDKKKKNLIMIDNLSLCIVFFFIKENELNNMSMKWDELK